LLIAAVFSAVFLEDILDTAKQEMFKIMKENEGKFAEVDDPEHVADVLGMSAVIIQVPSSTSVDFGEQCVFFCCCSTQDLTARRNKNYDFSWDRMLQAEGETGNVSNSKITTFGPNFLSKVRTCNTLTRECAQFCGKLVIIAH
jgi:hypothetical protein